MPRKTNPGRKLISLEAKEAGPEVSKQELLWKSGGTEISSLRKLMQEGVQLFRGFGERFAAFFYQTSSVWCVCKAPALVEWHMTVVLLSREGAQGKEVPMWKILTFPAEQ